MISIRCNTFETNSSSTHSICYGKLNNVVSKDYLLKMNDTYTPGGLDEGVLLTPEEKLKWLLTAIRQVFEYEENPFCVNLLYNLKELLPNAKIDMLNNLEHFYEAEDIDCVFEDYSDEPKGIWFLEKDNLIKFLTEYVVVWGDRDFGWNEYTWESEQARLAKEYNEIWHVSG